MFITSIHILTNLSIGPDLFYSELSAAVLVQVQFSEALRKFAEVLRIFPEVPRKNAEVPRSDSEVAEKV